MSFNFRFGKNKKTEKNETKEFSEVDVENTSLNKKNSSDLESAENSQSVLINKLSERLNYLENLRKEQNDDFNKLNLIIGKLRSRLMDQERYIRMLEVKSVKAEEFFNLINPMSITKKIEEQMAREEALNAKLDAFTSMAESIKKEVDEISSKIKMVGSEERIKQMNKDIQKLLQDSLKKDSRLGLDLEKSLSMFNEMRKNYTQLVTYFGKLNSAIDSLKQLNSKQEKMAVSLHNYVSRDIYSKKMSEFNRYIKTVEDNYKSLIKQVGLKEEAIKNFNVKISDSLKNKTSFDDVESSVNKNKFVKLSSSVEKTKNDVSKENSKKKDVKKIDTKKDDDLIFTRSY